MKTKRLLAWLLALCLVLPGFTFPVSGADAPDGGTFGTLTWEYDGDGTLTIAGEGKMPDYTGSDIGGAPWYPYRNNIVKVVVLEGVTSIGMLAFYRCKSLKSVTLPDSLTYIGIGAFGECSSLFDVDMSAGITCIDMSAFSRCTQLTNITLPEALTSIAYEAFSGDTGLTNIVIPENVASIGERAFYGCTGLKKVTFLTTQAISIEENAFGNCPVTIYGHAGSYIEQYALQMGFNFVPLESNDPADQNCPGNFAGLFNGVRACMDINSRLHICENNFPDENFREYVMTLAGAEDEYFTAEECQAIKGIYATRKEICTLAGIEFFSSLRELYCEGNQITSLDLSSAPNLAHLDCGTNQLTSLNLSGCSNLQQLNCFANQLTSLDLSSTYVLRYLDCSANQITSLNIPFAFKLEQLNCEKNKLTSLDLPSAPVLWYLDYSANQITSFNISSAPRLEALYCYDNRLATLDLSGFNALHWFIISPQAASFTAAAQNGKWIVDLGGIVGAKNVKNVLSVSAGTWDKNAGTVTFDAEPEEFVYTYDTGRRNIAMDVTLTKVVPGSTHTATVNGVTGEYAPGDEVKLSVPAFYTANGWAYRFVGWSGDVDCIVDPESPDTAFIMPDRDVVLTPVYILVGDLNGDGVLDASDALNMARILAGSVPGKTAADIDGDGMITTGDLVYMRRYLAGTYVPAK